MVGKFPCHHRFPKMLVFLISGVAAARSYGISVDCGSTGSRVYIYSWDGDEKWPKVRPCYEFSSYSEKFPIKLADAAKNASIIPDLVSNIKRFAKDRISYDEIRTAKFTLYATAGMRLLPQSEQDRIIEDTARELHKVTDFRFVDSNVRVITGEDEAYFAWLSVNSLQSNFTTPSSVGITELGGASMQIAQETDTRDHSAKYRTFKYNDYKHYVYVHSFLGLGIVEYYNAIGKLFVKEDETVEFPCLNKGYLVYFDGLAALGSSNFEKCFETVKENLLPTIKKASIPALSSKIKQFYGLGSFSNYATFANISVQATQEQALEGAKRVCALTKDEMELIAKDDPFKLYYCLNGILQYHLVYNGFKLSNEISFLRTENVNGISSSWTLGATLDQISPPDFYGSNYIWIFVLVAIIVTIILVIVFVIFVFCRKGGKHTESDMLNSTALLGAY